MYNVARPVTQPLNFEDIQARYSTVLAFVNLHFRCICVYMYMYMCMCMYTMCLCCRKSGMRRGMLMTVLQQYAHEQDVWRGKPGERCVHVHYVHVYIYMYMY